MVVRSVRWPTGQGQAIAPTMDGGGGSSCSLSCGLGELLFSCCVASIVTLYSHIEVVLLIENFQDKEEAMPLFVVVFQCPGIPGKRPILTFLGEHTS